MFILKTDSDGSIVTLDRGNRARYDELRQVDPTLLFFEEQAVSSLFDVAEFVTTPSKFRILASTYIVRLPD